MKFCPVVIYNGKSNEFLLGTPTFFKPTYLRAPEDSEQNLDTDFGSEFHVFFIYDVSRTFLALSRGFWRLFQGISRKSSENSTLFHFGASEGTADQNQ